MAVADTLNTLITDLTNAYTTLENKGADIPTNKNTNNLAETIQSLNVGNITSEVITKTLDVESSTNITFNTTKGQIPKLIILTNANYDTDGYSNFQSGEIRYVIYYTPMNRGICGTNNRVNGQTQNALVSPLNGSADMKPIISQSSVGFTRRSNTYYLANVEYKLTAYYWGDENIPSFTAGSNCTNALACKNLLTSHVTEDNAYTIFTTDLENNKLNNQMCYIAYSKINGTVWCISGTRYNPSNGRITQVLDMNTGNTIAYSMVINKGWKIYKTVIKIDGSAFNDDSELVGVLSGGLEEFSNENVKTIAQSRFSYSSSLKKIDLPNCTYADYYAFRNCSSLADVNLPKLTSIRNSVFYGCANLVTLDLPSVTNIEASGFPSCTKLTNLVLRRTSAITTLANVNAFQSTPFRNGTGGTVYVPRDLVSSYESATNWSSLESTTFAAIEDNIATLEALGLNVDEFK